MTRAGTMAGARGAAGLLALAAAALLSGCAATGNPFARTADAAAGPGEPAAAASDRDTEAPEVFQATDLALWDGRPSLGGVWAASPDARDPERVVLRNPGNGKSVVGALFRRERLNPGPPLQISSDAADALGMIAGQPAKISVTALRREAAAKRAGDGAGEADGAGATAALPGDATSPVETKALAPAAPVKATGKAPGSAAPFAASAAQPAAGATRMAGGRVQIGIFSVEANARRAAAKLETAGLPAQVVAGRAQDKDFWRLNAGPAPDADALLARVKAQGFPDAFVVNR